MLDRLEKLPEATEKALGSLKADDALKYRILKAAAETGEKKRKTALRPVILVLSVAAVMVLALSLFSLNRPDSDNLPEISHFTAGVSSKAEALLPEDVNADNIAALILSDAGETPVRNISVLLEKLREAKKIKPDKMPEWSGTLLLRLKDGREYTWPASEPYLYDGESVWECPSFFGAFGQ